MWCGGSELKVWDGEVFWKTGKSLFLVELVDKIKEKDVEKRAQFSEDLINKVSTCGIIFM